MSDLSNFLTFEYDSAYDLEYDLNKQRTYSEPKIYDAKGNLSKRWYVYYSFRDPATGKLKRQTPIYGKANQYTTKGERLDVLTKYRRSLSRLLKRGFNPYQDNSTLLQPTDQQPAVQPVSQPAMQSAATRSKKPVAKPKKKKGTPVASALKTVMEQKQKTLSQSSYRNYIGTLKRFERWLKNQTPRVKYIEDIDKKTVVGFLNYVLSKSSARTRNNVRADLSSVFSTLEDNELIPHNFVLKINVLHTRPERHKTYTQKQIDTITEYLQKEDPLLLLFVEFVSYNFLRPIEVCRLRLSDIDVNEQRLYVRAKNKAVKTKIIPDILMERLPPIASEAGDAFLFTPDGCGLPWNANETNRRDHFSKRYRNVVKKKFNLGKEYGLYSFRHTFITKLYRKMAENATPFEVKSKLMLITGHSTMTALEKYLRDIDAQLPEDYSGLLR